MYIRQFSDLHIEFGDVFIPPELDTDKDTILILNGDINADGKGITYANSLSSRFKYVILVNGNHCYYTDKPNTTISTIIKHQKRVAKENVFVLENESIEIDGVAFFGATLWTDLNKNDPFTMMLWEKYMVDPRKINIKPGVKLKANDTYLMHNNSLECLHDFLDANKGKNKVVITHHCPLLCDDIIPLPYKGKESNYFFNTDLQYLTDQVDYWFYGHTHYNKCVGNVMCNQRGYSHEGGHFGEMRLMKLF